MSAAKAEGERKFHGTNGVARTGLVGRCPLLAVGVFMAGLHHVPTWKLKRRNVYGSFTKDQKNKGSNFR